jgi:hypothetical protein
MYGGWGCVAGKEATGNASNYSKEQRELVAHVFNYAPGCVVASALTNLIAAVFVTTLNSAYAQCTYRSD